MKPNRKTNTTALVALSLLGLVCLSLSLLSVVAPASDVATVALVSSVVALALVASASVSRTRHLSMFALGLLAMGCEPACASGQLTPGAKRTLGEVVSRVDVARLLQCGGAGDATAIAKCLGARVLTEGLEEAIFRAQSLAEQAEQAGNEAAGADDMTVEQKNALAVDLDNALDQLGHEIAVANEL